MTTTLPYFVAALMLGVGSCTRTPHVVPATGPRKPQPDVERPTAAERLVESLDRSSAERLSPPRLATFELSASALGITVPPSPETWQQILTAALHASRNTQLFLFVVADQFGDAYTEAACKTFEAGAVNSWVKISCIDWEIKKWREEPRVAESALRITKQMLEAHPEPPTPDNVVYIYTGEVYWTGIDLHGIWYVPKEAQQSRADLLAWVNFVLSNREHWYYSSERKVWFGPIRAKMNGASAR